MQKDINFERISFIFLRIKNKMCIFADENSDLKYNSYEQIY